MDATVKELNKKPEIMDNYTCICAYTVVYLN